MTKFDYSITWKYIVDRMGERYGFYPDNEEKCSFDEIITYLEGIWDEFYKSRTDFYESKR